MIVWIGVVGNKVVIIVHRKKKKNGLLKQENPEFFCCLVLNFETFFFDKKTKLKAFRG